MSVCVCGLDLKNCKYPKCGIQNKVRHSCMCGNDDSDCSYPDCQNGAYHGTSPMTVQSRKIDHHVKPVTV